MKPLRLKQALGVVATFGAITLVAPSLAEIDSSAVPPAHFAWNRDPAVVVVSYREIWGEFANQDPTPLIRVFGDGRVLVHHPSYTSKAGDYEMWLHAAELENLLSSLLANGLATFETRAVENLKRSKEQGRMKAALAAQKPAEIFVVADESISVFELNLTAVSSGELQRKISWSGLGTDAEKYPDIEPIQKLRAAELQLRALLEHDDLWGVR